MLARAWVLPPSITAGFALAFLLLLATGIWVRQSQFQAGEVVDEIGRTHDVLDQTDAVLGRLVDAETGERGYLLTGDARYLTPYEEALAALPAETAKLHDLCAAHAGAAARLARLDELTRTLLDDLRRAIDLRRREGPGAPTLRPATEAGRETMTALRAVLDDLRSDERAALVASQAARAVRRGRNRNVTSLGLTFAAVLAAATILALNRQTARRLRAEEERDRSLRAEVALEERARVAEALRENEEDLRAMFTHSPLGKGQIDARTCRLLRVNPRLCEITGYAEAELLGMTFDQITAPEDREENLATFRRALEGDARAYAVEKRYVRKDGARVWVQVDATFIRDAQGRATRVISVIQDITGRKAAEAEREGLLRVAWASRAEAEATSHAKDEFLAVLSHEMRSPLYAMLGWLAILKRRIAQGLDVRHAVEIVERNAGLQAKLVNDLLDVSRIVSRKLTIAEDRVDLSALVRTAVEGARPAAEAKGVTLGAAVAPSVGFVVGEEPRLMQVMGNLLTNAVKFTPGGGQVSVTLSGGAGEATIEVRDTGAGIAPAFLAHVFDLFRQEDATSTREQGGLGIGLYLVKTLVELHGGGVEARSEGAGKGAAFTVRLPLQTAAAARAPRSDEAAAGAAAALAGVTVLLLEDDADSREALRLCLELSGAEVRACASAAEARRVLETVRPDVIVSDVGMPGEDGHAFIRSLRARGGPRVPAVAITGFAGRQDREDAVRAGFDDHLAKPVRADVLIARLQEIAPRSGPRLVAAPAPPARREDAAG